MTIRLRNLSDLYGRIAIVAPGLNENSAIDELRYALLDFCMETHCSQDTIETSIAAGETAILYDSPSPSHLFVCRVLSVDLPTGNLPIRTLDELREFGNWREAEGPPRICTPEAPGELSTYPTTQEAITPIYVRIALAPTQTTTKIDEDVLNRYGNAIADGAIARILGMPGQTWSNPNEAMRRQRMFDIARSRARAESAKNQAHSTIQHRIRRQF